MPDAILQDDATAPGSADAPPTRLPGKRTRRATKTVAPDPAPVADAPPARAPPPQRTPRGIPAAATHRTGAVPHRQLYPIDEARQLLGGMSHTAFYAAVRRGEIETVHIGRRTYVSAIVIARLASGL